MTTFNYLRSTKAVEKAEETLGGPLREVLRTKLNEPGITVSSIAKDVNVQKATINYWMARLGINYGRVAHYFDEVVRILSQDESELLDTALEIGLTAEDLSGANPKDAQNLRRLEELGVSAEEIGELSATLLVALRRLSRMGLTDDQIDLIDAGMLEAISSLNREGVSSNNLAMLTGDEVEFVNKAREDGVDIQTIGTVGNDWISLIRDAKEREIAPASLASVDLGQIGVLDRAKQRGIDLSDLDGLSAEDLELAKKIREKRSRNPEQVTAWLAMMEVM